ncbi:MAG TPA: hypothetical protein VMH06_07210 [Thermodesulfovibrionales bacterium]|nr:hypothetical protein [Thermodesulfovibrionales bacterium]
MPRTFKVVEAFDIRGHGVLLVGDKAFSDFREIKTCDIEIIKPNGDVLKGVAFKEWLLYSTTPEPDEIEAFFIRGMNKSDIPIGSMVRVKQEEVTNRRIRSL